MTMSTTNNWSPPTQEDVEDELQEALEDMGHSGMERLTDEIEDSIYYLERRVEAKKALLATPGIDRLGLKWPKDKGTDFERWAADEAEVVRRLGERALRLTEQHPQLPRRWPDVPPSVRLAKYATKAPV
jgi:hypothetical protein